MLVAVEIPTMRIAIAYWQGRVSPMFDASRNLMLVDIEKGQEKHRVEQTMTYREPLLRARSVRDTGADILICGSISSALEKALTAAGIAVVGYTCGPVNDVIAAFVSRTLMDEQFVMPGCSEQRRSNRHRQLSNILNIEQ